MWFSSYRQFYLSIQKIKHNMNIYALAKPLLFCLDAEVAHDVTIKSLKLATKLHLTQCLNQAPVCQPRTVMGITFPNPVGLAAGLDKNGAVIDGMAALGFGFIEVGTVTPRPQPDRKSVV